MFCLLQLAARSMIALALCVLLVACDQISASLFNDKAAAFAPIATGTDGWSRAAVEKVMGSAQRVQSTAVAGLDAEFLYFTDHRTNYRVLFVNGKAWLKTATPRTTPNPQKETQ